MVEPDLVLEHLRRIRGQLDEVQETQAEHTRRLTGLEHGQADIRRGISHDAVNAAEQSARIDRIAERLTRIERRLELRDDA